MRPASPEPPLPPRAGPRDWRYRAIRTAGRNVWHAGPSSVRGVKLAAGHAGSGACRVARRRCRSETAGRNRANRCRCSQTVRAACGAQRCQSGPLSGSVPARCLPPRPSLWCRVRAAHVRSAPGRTTGGGRLHASMGDFGRPCSAATLCRHHLPPAHIPEQESRWQHQDWLVTQNAIATHALGVFQRRPPHGGYAGPGEMFRAASRRAFTPCRRHAPRATSPSPARPTHSRAPVWACKSRGP